MRFKILAGYLLLAVAIILMINLYPPYIANELIEASRRDELLANANAVGSMLSADEVETQKVASNYLVKTVAAQYDRVIVLNSEASVVYDSARMDNLTGKTVIIAPVYSALSGTESFETEREDDYFRFTCAVPISGYDGVKGAVCIYKTSRDEASLMKSLDLIVLIFSVMILLTALILSGVFSRLITRQIDDISEGVDEAQKGNYGVKIRKRSNDELGKLAGVLNDMFDRQHAVEANRRAFISNASHEFKTPLASMKLLVESISDENMDEGLRREFLNDLDSEIDRLTRITERLMILTRMDGPEGQKFVELNVSDELESAMRFLNPMAQAGRVILTGEIEPDVRIVGVQDAFSQIAYNLIDNAIKYNKVGGRVMVRLKKDKGDCLFTVKDNGDGIPKTDVKNIFDRFYRVDKAHSRETGGTGLGLAIVKSTVELLNGTITVESSLTEGTEFFVRIPLSDEASSEKNRTKQF